MRNAKGQFMKGHKTWSGIKRDDAFKEACRKRQLGKKIKEETKKKMSESAKKYTHTPEHNKKVSESKIGDKNPMFGKEISLETRRKMSEVRKGEKSYLWKGGITKINEKIRGSLEYRLWREAVFKRDNYTCVLCSKRGKGDLNADHIKPFAYFPELRFDINNGRTLCVPCHRKTDTYGRKAIDLKGDFNEAIYSKVI